MIYIRCVLCGTLDFDARFNLRFKDHTCCEYRDEVQIGILPKRNIQLIFWANGEVGLDEHVRFPDSNLQ